MPAQTEAAQRFRLSIAVMYRHALTMLADSEPLADDYFLCCLGQFAVWHGELAVDWTALILRLPVRRRVDSLIVVGTTTSGCVRATVVDGASHGFPVVVVEDACFDRSRFAHASNLFDIQMKYGSVVASDDVVPMLYARSMRKEDTPDAEIHDDVRVD